MRGQNGLRPRARQNGRGPILFWRTQPHRPGEVILGDLQVVPGRDRLGDLHVAAAANALMVESPRRRLAFDTPRAALAGMR